MIDKKDYPVFCGQVVSVPAVIESSEGTVTIIDYMPLKNKPTEEDMKKMSPLGILSPLIDSYREKMQEDLEKRVKRVVVPMRIDPSILQGAEVRTRFAAMEYEGRRKVTYELEIIRGRSSFSGDMIYALAEHIEGPIHTGMKYVKLFDED